MSPHEAQLAHRKAVTCRAMAEGFSPGPVRRNVLIEAGTRKIDPACRSRDSKSVVSAPACTIDA